MIQGVSPLVITIVTVVALLLLLASGMYIGLAIGLVGILLIVLFMNPKLIEMVGVRLYNSANSFTLVALPLFIFMGNLLLRSGLGERVYNAATPWVSYLPGGLLHTNILGCAIFAAISGSSVACAATIGSIALPIEQKRGYSPLWTMGSVAAGGTLGNLIPPSTLFILYGWLTEESVGKLFMAGFLTGFLHAALMMSVIVIGKLVSPSITPPRERFQPRLMFSELWKVWPVALLVFLVLGTIYLGVATPTEAAAFGASGSLLLCILYRALSWKTLRETLLRATTSTCFIMLALVLSSVLGDALSLLRVPMYISNQVTSAQLAPWVVFMLIVIMYVVLGCFLDTAAMFLLTIPVVYPVMMALGFDSVWLGVVIVILGEYGLITPPVGFNLFVIQGISGRPFTDVVKGVIPFLPTAIILIILLYFFPQIALWLPSKMFKAF